MKKLFVFIVLANFSLLWFAPMARAGALEFFFPSLRTPEIDPSDTLQAPFAQDVFQGSQNAPAPQGANAEQPEQAQEPLSPDLQILQALKKTPEIHNVAKGQLPENAIALNKPHRDDKSIARWLITASSEVLAFDGADLKAEFAHNKTYFDAAGWQEYVTFLQEKGIKKVLSSGQYQIRSFVEDAPLLLNEGEINGRYRWLYEVPVMVSYMDRTLENYTRGDPVNQTIILSIQVGRSSEANNSDGVLMEHWSGKVKPSKK